MAELFDGFALLFSVPAFAGTFFFLIRLLLMLVGADGDFDDADGGDSSETFKVLSIQSISGFMMGFGWLGMGLFFQTGSVVVGIGAGLVGGTAMVWIIYRLLRLIMGLQSSGNIDIRMAYGEAGTVYIEVPGENNGKGRVRMVLDGRERYYDAVTDGSAITSGRTVRVVAVNEDNTLSVEAVEEIVP